MIVYDGILERLQRAGYSAYRIRQEKLIPNSTMDRLRHNGPITTETIDTICRLCRCQPGELLIWQPDEKNPED